MKLLALLRSREADGLEAGGFMRRAVIGLFLFGMAHRLLQLALLWPALHRQILFRAGVYFVAMLPTPIMTEHPWWGLWYLQETPPIEVGLLTLILALAHSPEAIALSCLAVQILLSCATAAAMALLMWRLRFRAGVALGFALLFLLSGDLLSIEYYAMGMMYHNLLSMFLLVLLCHVGLDIQREASLRSAASLGLIVALLFLTRATFSFFAPVIFVWLLWVAGRHKPMLLAAFLAPLLLLQGGWILKNELVFGYFNISSISLGGANLYQSETLRHGPEEFHDWIAGHPPVCPAPWYDLTVNMPSASTPVFFVPDDWPQGVLPPSVVAKDSLVTARRGGHLAPLDTLAAALWAQCVFKEFAAYWSHRPALAARDLIQSYELYWHPIREFAATEPTSLIPDMAPYAPGPVFWTGLADAFRELTGGYRMLERPVVARPFAAEDFRPVPVIALPVIPTAISLLNALALHSLPVLLLVRLWRRGSARFPTGFWLMVLVYLYAAGFTNLAAYGENMRYRLEVEPVIWTLSLLILWQWALFVRSFRKTAAG